MFLVRGEGDAVFSAGYDLTALGQPRDRLPDERLGEVLDRLGQHPAPSVALVMGPAVGAGCELSVACDFRVGSPRASFTMPPAKLGVVYALKGIERLRSRVGDGFARTMFLTGRRVEASQALARGLLDVCEEDALGAAETLCNELAANAPLAVSGLKLGLGLVARGVLVDDDYERLRRRSFSSEDAREGVAAALGKRAPEFLGR